MNFFSFAGLFVCVYFVIIVISTVILFLYLFNYCFFGFIVLLCHAIILLYIDYDIMLPLLKRLL